MTYVCLFACAAPDLPPSLSLQLTSLATPPPPTKVSCLDAEMADGEGTTALRRGGVLDSVMRTAGLVGLVGALAMQVRQLVH